jgi:hypothetical protein
VPNLVNCGWLSGKTVCEQYGTLERADAIPRDCVGEHIPEFGLVHSIGYGKSLAGKLVFLSVLEEKLNDDELKSISKELEALMEMDCIFKPAESMADEIMGALTAKFVAAERQRPDPIQMWTAFNNRALAEQRPAEEAIVDYIQELADATFGEAKKMTKNEATTVRWLCTLSPAAKQKLQYHWNCYKVSDSALPLSKMVQLISAIDENHSNAAEGSQMRDVLAPNAVKIEALINRNIGVFVWKLKEAALS